MQQVMYLSRLTVGNAGGGRGRPRSALQPEQRRQNEAQSERMAERQREVREEKSKSEHELPLAA